MQPDGTVTVIAEGLEAPWSVLRLDELGGGAASNRNLAGSTLISERDSGTIKELGADGTVRGAGAVAGVQHQGEGGLLGLAGLRQSDELWVYAYLTTASDSRIVRMPLRGEAGSLSLGAAQPILSGLAAAGNHNGGRIALDELNIISPARTTAGRTPRGLRRPRAMSTQSRSGRRARRARAAWAGPAAPCLWRPCAANACGRSTLAKSR